jgi:hypothetical protein
MKSNWLDRTDFSVGFFRLWLLGDMGVIIKDFSTNQVNSNGTEIRRGTRLEWLQPSENFTCNSFDGQKVVKIDRYIQICDCGYLKFAFA